MNEQEISSYSNLIKAIIGLVGILIGTFVTIYFNWKIKIKETKLRITEKIFDKRIIAHEEVLRIIKLLRLTHFTYQVDSNKNALTYPAYLHNRESFNNFISETNDVANKNSHWVGVNVFKELNYLQDYLVNLDYYLKSINERDYPAVGIHIKSDLIDMAYVLEKIILKFFKEDIYKINLSVTEGRHKYQQEETFGRLSKTKLLQLIKSSRLPIQHI